LRVVYSHHRRSEDLQKRIGALRSAGIPEWPYGFQGSRADLLDGQTVRGLAVDKLWVGHQHGGAQFMMQVTARGDYAQRGSQGLTAGKVVFRDNLMCMQTGALALGREFCSPVYRNPGGSRQGQDEYVFPDVATVWYFSVGS
jgi:adenylate cyclase